jgi:hypothetical protein
MKLIATVLVVAAVFACVGGNAYCDDIYFEGWDSGSTAGWLPNAAASKLSAGTSGGHPDGFLGVQGVSANSDQIGAFTTLPGATGDYGKAGVGMISFDVRFVSGYYVHLWVRIRPHGAGSPGWIYPAKISKAPGEDWRSVLVGLNAAWDNAQAQNGGWIGEVGAPSFKESTADVYSVEIVFIASESVDTRIDNFRLSTQPECPETLPDPVLVFNGKSVAGDFLIKWEFAIENWEDYPADMFLPAPDLPPCGPNAGAPRTSHSFKRSSGRGLADFCGVTSPAELQNLFFTAGNIGAPDVYVELVDRRCNKTYRSNTVSTVYVNDPPDAVAGDDLVVECAGETTPVVLDGTASSDPEGEDITFEWVAQGVLIDEPTAAKTTGYFPKGTHHAVLKVRDKLNLSTDVIEINVVDTSPPDLRIALDRSIVWPPNHKYFDIHATVTADDACGEVSSIVFMGVYDTRSSEPAAGVLDAQIGTLDTHFRVLAERDGQESGREWGIVYMALDNSLNLVSDTVYVSLPHDRSGHARSALGFDARGRAFASGASQFALVVPSLAGRGSNAGFDATAIDVGGARVGNSKGTVSPSSAYRGDVDGDKLEDMVLLYSSSEAKRLIDIADDAGETLSFYYRNGSDEVYTIEDVFGLGKPMSIRADDLRPVRGYGRVAGMEDPFVRMMLATPASQTALGQAYPNPFNPSTTIPFQLTTSGDVALRIYDARGKLVRTLKNESMPAGSHHVIWNGRDNSGRQTATGVYFVRMTAGNHEMTRKIVMIK